MLKKFMVQTSLACGLGSWAVAGGHAVEHLQLSTCGGMLTFRGHGLTCFPCTLVAVRTARSWSSTVGQPRRRPMTQQGSSREIAQSTVSGET